MSGDTVGGNTTPGIGAEVSRGLAWSMVNNLSVRMSNVVLGIVLARLLVPADFGVFAVALTVQAVLMAVADLGLSADLIRRGGEARRGPTIASLAAVTGLSLAAAMAIFAGPIAGALGSRDAADVVRVLAGTLVLSGISVVPYAFLQRRFMQRQLFGAEAASLVVSTTVVLVLVVGFDQGAMALAWSRLAGQLITTVLLFWWARTPLRFGFDRAIAAEAIRFSAPLAAANLVSWALLNLDYVVISRVEGAVLLGFYVLAFNMSSWPMTAVGQAIRNVALPAFSRQDQAPAALARSLRRSLGLAWTAGLFVSVMLGVLATPVIVTVYGARWQVAAGPLVALAALGCLRIVFDLFAAFLISRGAGRSVLVIQLSWIAVLLPVMILGTTRGGIVGAGVAHVVTAVLVVLPAYLLALRRCGVAVVALLAECLPAVLAAAAAGVAAWLAAAAVSDPVASLLAGGLAGTLVYAAGMWRWVRGRVAAIRSDDAGGSAGGGSGDEGEAGPVPTVKIPAAVPIISGGLSVQRLPTRNLHLSPVGTAGTTRAQGRHVARPDTTHDQDTPPMQASR